MEMTWLFVTEFWPFGSTSRAAAVSEERPAPCHCIAVRPRIVNLRHMMLSCGTSCVLSEAQDTCVSKSPWGKGGHTAQL